MNSLLVGLLYLFSTVHTAILHEIYLQIILDMSMNLNQRLGSGLFQVIITTIYIYFGVNYEE